eukprot:TRINITY_DN19192_c0_g1_i1.p2 TRINITY_DN19192_c0_g1~~TRINITY_DN19192_c0_g1_i1.p2  ORF type:complete len:101 (+),score=45.21 TRINITY_DN19192_c0_g1_i1:25-327(+)
MSVECCLVFVLFVFFFLFFFRCFCFFFFFFFFFFFGVHKRELVSGWHVEQQWLPDACANARFVCDGSGCITEIHLSSSHLSGQLPESLQPHQAGCIGPFF